MTLRMDGGAAIVAWLKAAGVENIFSVSGGPINAIYRACAHQGLPLIHTRHEAAACFMAESFSRVTGKAGAVVVTLGPGVTNAVTPALVASLAGTPMIIIGAQSATRSFDRGAGMSYDVLPVIKGVTKWAARCIDPNRIGEYLDMAWRKMWAGRPGPVFLEVPTDILSGALREEFAADPVLAPPRPSRPGIVAADADAARAMCGAAKRPLLLLGDETFWDRSSRIQEAVERHGLPFSTLRLARGVLNETHRNFAGPGYTACNPALRRALAEADLVFLIGHHFEFDLEFGDSLGAGTKVLQLCSDPELLHRNRRAELAIAACPSSFFEMLADMSPMQTDAAWVSSLLSDWTEEWQRQSGAGDNTGLHPVVAIDAVTDAAPERTIFVSSHGNVDFWADARMKFADPGRYLRAGQSGSLGAEVPYGAGASFADPDVPVIVFVGDGGVGYHVTELDTAERYGRSFIIVVLDDEQWGAISLPQQQSFGETFQTDLPRRDWTKVAEGLGCNGYFCRDPEAIGAAIKSAIAAGKPAIVQVPVRSVISPYMAYIS